MMAAVAMSVKERLHRTEHTTEVEADHLVVEEEVAEADEAEDQTATALVQRLATTRIGRKSF